MSYKFGFLIWHMLTAAELAALQQITFTKDKQLELSHPETEGVLIVYGTILTDGNDDYLEEITDTMCVYLQNERSIGNRVDQGHRPELLFSTSRTRSRSTSQGHSEVILFTAKVVRGHLCTGTPSCFNVLTEVKC
uniref:Uncharacterized protein n=1 Tax=Magallana gigas TaxID=29159 RepID=A0A8W8HRQ0_MAGGI